jgi:chaperonin cofactor prefoldin
MSEGRSAETRASQRFGKALGSALRWLLRLLLVVMIGVGLGMGLYFGGIFLYQQYILPVQVHAIRLDVLEARQEEVAGRLTQRIDDAQERVRGLEAQQDQDKQALARLEAQIVAAATAQAAQAARLDRLAAIGSDMATLQTALAQLEEAQGPLRANTEALQLGQEAAQAGLEALRQDLQALGQELDATASGLDTLQTQADTLSEDGAQRGEALAALQERLSGEQAPESMLRSLQVLRAMELLTRSRLLLVQNNVGLARADLSAARDLMIELQPAAPADEQGTIEAVAARLQVALEALPESPVAAADALEGAWQLLLAGLSPGPKAATEWTATAPAPEATSTVEATATVEQTPVAEATPTPAQVTPTVEVTPTPQS